jgi:hypothetical protein
MACGLCGHDSGSSATFRSSHVIVSSACSGQLPLLSDLFCAQSSMTTGAHTFFIANISLVPQINQLQCRIVTDFFRISCRRPCLSCLLLLHQLELYQTSRLHTPFRQELSIPLLSVPVFWARFMLLLMLNPRKMRQLLFSVTHAKRASILTPHLRHISHHMSAALFMAASLLDRVVLFPII